MSPWWLLLIVPASIAVGVGLVYWLLVFYLWKELWK